MIDRTGNLPPQPGIVPTSAAPIMRISGEGRELTVAIAALPQQRLDRDLSRRAEGDDLPPAMSWARRGTDREGICSAKPPQESA